MPKRITNEEERKFPFTISINARTLKMLDRMVACLPNHSRSAEIESAIRMAYRYWRIYGGDMDNLDEIPPCLPEEEDI